MAEGTASLYVGEQKKVTATGGGPAGVLLTITAGTFTLYLCGGASGLLQLAAFNPPLPVTGFDAGSRPNPTAYYLLPSSVTSALVPGSYLGVFSLNVSLSDGTTNVYQPEVLITVKARGS